ncbi:Hypothetical predicted protein [Mytilus galloprovincialis]|uniref:Uncharacterized protein n=1 Tax=Mytilus galloprovincialis TaxID=29158 RepID=A0A8B6CMU2_MYTGA|nr:Hypothetical predicted protein [Mytilus galloprovincialis]
MKHYLRTSRIEEGLSKGKAIASGVTYARWGRTECPTGVEMVYTSGQAGGNQYTHKGGGVNYLCLPNNPENGEPFSAATNQIFGAEYELASSQVPSGMKNQKTLHNKEEEKPATKAGHLSTKDISCQIIKITAAKNMYRMC